MPLDSVEMSERDHNPAKRRLHLPIVGVTNGPGGTRIAGPKPPWLKVTLRNGPNHAELRQIVRDRGLHTVCEEAMCPNIHECWEEREATFLLLGSRCTRRCGFCDVMTAKPDPVDADEPRKIAEAAAAMGLRFVVITGVARDDLRDGGASIWAETVMAVKRAIPGVQVEVLPSDFKGGERDIATVLEAEPDVFAHNLETVRRLHDRIRPAFGYDRSLEVLRIAKRMRPGQITKSNLILGMGERPDEIQDAMTDLGEAGCDILTMGQYLQPTTYHLPVDRWVTPEEFNAHARGRRVRGIRMSRRAAGPLGYHAGHSSGAQRRRACRLRRRRPDATSDHVAQTAGQHGQHRDRDPRLLVEQGREVPPGQRDAADVGPRANARAMGLR